MNDTMRNQEQQIIPLAREVTNTLKEKYSYNTDTDGNRQKWPEPGWIQAEKLEPNTRNRIYSIGYERNEITCGKKKRGYEVLHLFFSGGEEWYQFILPATDKSESEMQEIKSNIHQVQQRFTSMNYALHESVINSLSQEARQCLEKILSEK